jgi:prepilin-type N-terminal cleavage/methylation domain-containing protein
VQRGSGFTLVEMLVTLGVIGILLGLVGFMLRVPSAQLLANDVQSAISQARLQSIKYNQPVSVMWDSANQRFSSRRSNDSTITKACARTTTPYANKSVNEYGGSPTVTLSPAGAGLVWLPSGLLTTCTGVPTATTIITITANNITRRLSISPVGEVSIQ